MPDNKSAISCIRGTVLRLRTLSCSQEQMDLLNRLLLEVELHEGVLTSYQEHFNHLIDDNVNLRRKCEALWAKCMLLEQQQKFLEQQIKNEERKPTT